MPMQATGQSRTRFEKPGAPEIEDWTVILLRGRAADLGVRSSNLFGRAINFKNPDFLGLTR